MTSLIDAISNEKERKMKELNLNKIIEEGFTTDGDTYAHYKVYKKGLKRIFYDSCIDGIALRFEIKEVKDYVGEKENETRK